MRNACTLSPSLNPEPTGDVLHLLHIIPANATCLPVPPACCGNSGYSECIVGPEQMEVRHLCLMSQLSHRSPYLDTS